MNTILLIWSIGLIFTSFLSAYLEGRFKLLSEDTVVWFPIVMGWPLFIIVAPGYWLYKLGHKHGKK